MKNLLLIAQLWAFLAFYFPFQTSISAQTIAGTVYDKTTGETLPFVTIRYGETANGTIADVNGFFEIPADVNTNRLLFSFVGYDALEVLLSEQTTRPLEVYMEPASLRIEEVVIIAGENPAHRIIRNALRNRDLNNPENLDAFSYNSYNKLVLSILTDSMDLTDSRGNVDSSALDVKEFAEKQHLFMMESITKRAYKKPNKNEERVLANRVSGLKNPDFVLLANQLQSFSFYTDYIKVLDQEYLNPIAKGFERKYFFNIEDTLYTGPDTTYIISFKPKKNFQFKPLEGILYINSSTWAIQNVIASPSEQDDFFKIRIEQLYKRIDGKSWFPTQLNYELWVPEVDFEGAEIRGIGRTYLDSIEINPELDEKKFSRVVVKLDRQSTKRNEGFWNTYRMEPITPKDLETYQFMDSLGEANNFERKLRWGKALANGYVRFNFIDVPLDRFIRFNVYEGFRLGFGAQTNENLVEWMQFGGYFAYGFRDKRSKYGGYVNFDLDQDSKFSLGLGHRFDLYETGGDQWIERPWQPLLKQSFARRFFVELFDEVEESYAYLNWHPIANLHTRLQFSRQQRRTKGGYEYNPTPEIEDNWTNQVNSSLIQLAVTYAPRDEYIEGPFGRRPIKETFPKFTAQYTRALDDVWGGETDFHRVDLKIEQQFKTKEFGITSIEIQGGQVFGDAPYSFLFAGRSNQSADDFGRDYFFIADRVAFETMQNNEFINDRYLHIIFRQNFEQRLLRIKKWMPEINAVFRFMIGEIDNPEFHRGLTLTDTNHGFFEGGIEINKIWNGIGLGTYYRFGAYHLPKEFDNWGLKMTFRSAFFNN